MAKKRYRPEEIIGKPREVDVLISQGKKVVQGTTALGLTEVTESRRQQHGRFRRRTSSPIYTLDGT